MISVPLSIAEYQCTCAKIHDSIETVCDSWVTKRTYSAHYAVGATACSTSVVEATDLAFEYLSRAFRTMKSIAVPLVKNGTLSCAGVPTNMSLLSSLPSAAQRATTPLVISQGHFRVRFDSLLLCLYCVARAILAI